MVTFIFYNDLYFEAEFCTHWPSYTSLLITLYLVRYLLVLESVERGGRS